MEGLNEARMVHYVSYNGKSQAAIVTGTYSEHDGAADLAVLWNIEDAKCDRTGGLSFHFKVAYDETAMPGTWHWIFPGQATYRYKVG